MFDEYLTKAILSAGMLADEIRELHAEADAVTGLLTEQFCREVHELLHRLERLESARRANVCEVEEG